MALHFPTSLLAAALFAAPLGSAQVDQPSRRPTKNFADMSIEELMNEPVTSVSKKETRLNDSPAAISVITPDDIRRLGITNLTEALRLVPGMDGARITGNEWAVSARGFNNEFAKDLLVLIDGRTVYTPASAGVFWNAQDVVLEDLDRIEVIRGPGATLWGANAVNGVVNITTKSAKETQGGLVSASVGSEDQPTTTARYGGQLATDLYYRVYLKYFNRGKFTDVAGNATPDNWNALRGGFRADWEPPSGNRFTLQGDYYDGEAGKRVNRITLSPAAVVPLDVTEHNRGHNVVGRWTRTFSATSSLTAQAYYDRVEQGDGFGEELRDTGDLDVQHRFAVGAAHDIVWGAGYRHTSIDNTPSFNLTWTPERHKIDLFEMFVQDDITIVPDRLHLILGSKFEHNNFTGWEPQPSARLWWTPSENQTVWAAAARADRTPSLFEQSARLNVAAFQPPSAPPFLVSIFGNQNISDEELDAYEVGYRIEPAQRLSFDVAGFYNEYRDLTALVANPTVFEPVPAPPHLLSSTTWQNSQTARTYGAEVSVQWQVTDSWRLIGSYTGLHMQVRPDPVAEGDSPRRQFQLRSYLNLPANWELNGALYHVDAITPQSGGARAAVPAYVRLDLGVTWRPTPALELGVWGQNLTDRRHSEYASQESTLLTQVPRGITGRVTWRF